MNSLKFKHNSWHAWLWTNTYGDKKLPDNICSYFWSLVFAIVTAPLNVVGHLFNIINGRTYRKQNVLLGIVFNILWVIGYIVWEIYISNNKDTHFYGAWYIIILKCIGGVGIILGFIVSVFLVMTGIVLSVQWIHKKIKSLFKDKQTQEKPNPLIEGWKAFKGKYCSRINWE